MTLVVKVMDNTLRNQKTEGNWATGNPHQMLEFQPPRTQRHRKHRGHGEFAHHFSVCPPLTQSPEQQDPQQGSPGPHLGELD